MSEYRRCNVPKLLPAVFERLFDDAGLFPPASRPMAEALRAHEQTRSGPHRGLVGSFVCPVSRLGELDACVAGGVPRPAEISLVAHGGEADMRRALTRTDVVQVEAPLEATMPHDVLRLRRYLELPPHGEVEAAVERVGHTRAGVKLRCGGVTSDLVPPPRRVAQVLAACARRRLPLKLTAGLHHAFRVGPSSPGGPRHGIVNLLAAASAAVAGAGVDHLTSVLDTEEDEGAELVGRIDRHARSLVTAIGTCSVDEPVTELQALGML
jgi:hypothetical protein